MFATFTVLWITVVCLIAMNLIYLVLWLRSKPPQRKARSWVGMLSIGFISLAALMGLLYAQFHAIDLFKAGSYFLFLAAFFVEQLIARWTLNNPTGAQPLGTFSARWSKGFTGFVIIYALFALAAAIFHL